MVRGIGIMVRVGIGFRVIGRGVTVIVIGCTAITRRVIMELTGVTIGITEKSFGRVFEFE